MCTFEVIEFEIRQADSVFVRTLSARSRSLSLVNVTAGYSNTSDIRSLPSTMSSLPLESHVNDLKFNFEFSAIARKVVMKQLTTAAVNKCSGDQIPGMPFGNSGGVATSIQEFSGLANANSGEHILPFRSWLQVRLTL